MTSPPTPMNGNRVDSITRHELEALGLIGFEGMYSTCIHINGMTGEATIYLRGVSYGQSPHPLARIFGNQMMQLTERHLHQKWCTGGCYLSPKS